MPDMGVSNIIHYLDDFFIIGSPHTSKRINNVATLHTYMTGNLNPFPVVECTLSLYVASLHSEGLSSNTAKTYLARIWYTQIMMGPSDPRIADMQQLQYTIRGFHKVYGGKACPCFPITPLILVLKTQGVLGSECAALLRPVMGSIMHVLIWLPLNWRGRGSI